jgi:WG containing repeat
MLKLANSNSIWGYRWGYQNEQNLFVIPPLFAEAYEFSEGLAAVKFICSWGYINELGEVVILPIFDDAKSFSEGIAIVKFQSEYKYIDRNGEFTTPPPAIIEYSNSSDDDYDDDYDWYDRRFTIP